MPIEFPVASAVGWFLIAAAGGALFVQYRSLKGRSYAVLSGRTRPAIPRHLTSRGQAGVLTGLTIFFLVALGAVSTSFLQGFDSTFTGDQLTLNNYRHALTSSDLRAPLLLSFKLAALGATCAIILGTIVGRLLARPGEAGATALHITHDQAEAFTLADVVGVLNRGRLVQLGAPETIYAAPATPFVARLTGLAGVLPRTVLASDEAGMARVVNNGVTLLARRGEQLPAGAAARVLLRPAAVLLLAEKAGTPQLRARVRDAAFVGRGYEHVVELPDGTRLTGVFADTRFDRGQPVGVQLGPRRCMVFGEPACAESAH